MKAFMIFASVLISSNIISSRSFAQDEYTVTAVALAQQSNAAAAAFVGVVNAQTMLSACYSLGYSNMELSVLFNILQRIPGVTNAVLHGKGQAYVELVKRLYGQNDSICGKSDLANARARAQETIGYMNQLSQEVQGR